MSVTSWRLLDGEASEFAIAGSVARAAWGRQCAR